MLQYAAPVLVNIFLNNISKNTATSAKESKKKAQKFS